MGREPHELAMAIWIPRSYDSPKKEYFLSVLNEVPQEKFNTLDRTYGTTMLMHVIRQGWDDAVMAVLNHKYFDPDTINTREQRPVQWPEGAPGPICRTALHLAALAPIDRHRQVLGKLLEIPNIQNLPDGAGATPLMIIMTRQDYVTAHLMLEVFSGDNINSIYKYRTVLQVLSEVTSSVTSSDSLKMCAALLENGADPNMVTGYWEGGITPFYLAIQWEQFQQARLMLKYTTVATLNLKIVDDTALSFVSGDIDASADVRQMCNELLEAGADPNLADSLSNAIPWALKNLALSNKREHALDVLEAHLSTNKCSDKTKADAFSKLLGQTTYAEYSKPSVQKRVQKVANLFIRNGADVQRDRIQRVIWFGNGIEGNTKEQTLAMFDDLVANYYAPEGPGAASAATSFQSLDEQHRPLEKRNRGGSGGNSSTGEEQEAKRYRRIRFAMPSLYQLRI